MRRKSKDNPYTINVNNNIYFVTFKDGCNNLNEVEVSKEVYEVFDQNELKDISQMHKVEKYYDFRRIDNSDYTGIVLFFGTKSNYKSLEDEVIENIDNEKLYEAINKLSEVQKRRIKMYFFEDLNYTQIARIESCDESSVRESIHSALKKLKNLLK